MRKTLIAIGVVSIAMIGSPALAYTEPGLGSINRIVLAAPAPAVAVSQPVSEPKTVTPSTSAPIVAVQSAAPAAQPAPAPIVQQVVPTVDPTPVNVPVPVCDANFSVMPCDWSSLHFGTTISTSADLVWVDFFQYLEAGLLDGSIHLDPVTFEFVDAQGNVVW